MLLKTYTKEVFRAKCNPGFKSVHCIAHLDQDAGPALPFLNAALGGFDFYNDPSAVSFKVRGKPIKVDSHEIAVNALEDEAEADKILEWMKNGINDALENRDRIDPRYQGMPKTQLLEVLKLLPRTNCRECGQPTCMVFSAQVTEGIKDLENFPSLDEKNRGKINAYLAQFTFDP
jgi:ArsR family metal-binding transcriptional regulator